MIIWGIDPGKTPGYASLDDGALRWNGEWDLGDDLARRAHTFYLNLQALAREGMPHAIGCERGGWTNTMIAVQHGGYFACIEMFAAQHGITVVRYYAPATIKKRAIGSGRADKAASMDAFEARWGHWPNGDNAADAAHVAWCAWIDSKEGTT